MSLLGGGQRTALLTAPPPKKPRTSTPAYPSDLGLRWGFVRVVWGFGWQRRSTLPQVDRRGEASIVVFRAVNDGLR